MILLQFIPIKSRDLWVRIEQQVAPSGWDTDTTTISWALTWNGLLTYRIVACRNHSTGCSNKKRLLRRCLIFNPKNVTIGSCVDRNKKLPSFWPIGPKLPFFNGKFSLAIENSKLSCEISIFWPMDHKDRDFLFWSTLKNSKTLKGLSPRRPRLKWIWFCIQSGRIKDDEGWNIPKYSIWLSH